MHRLVPAADRVHGAVVASAGEKWCVWNAPMRLVPALRIAARSLLFCSGKSSRRTRAIALTDWCRCEWEKHRFRRYGARNASQLSRSTRYCTPPTPRLTRSTRGTTARCCCLNHLATLSRAVRSGIRRRAAICATESQRCSLTSGHTTAVCKRAQHCREGLSRRRRCAAG